MMTKRQQEVAARIASGMNNKEIARDMRLSIGTIRCHVRAVLDKMNVRNRVCAAVTWDRLTR